MTATRGAQSGFSTSNGFAVYNFDLDLTTPGTSACLSTIVPPATAACTTFWPPIRPPAGVTLVAPFGTITRADGTTQLAYNNHPLYTYAEDTSTTNAAGDGLNVSGGLWHLAQPQTADLSTPIVLPTTAPAPGAGSYAEKR
jgi:predicted lipoprotein with Yx(FWY)xxD motif